MLVLDKKDKAILQQLDIDPRASFASIARSIKANQELVKQRVVRLQEKGVLTGFWAIIDTPKTRIVHKLLLKNRSLCGQKKEEFWAFLAQNGVTWFAQTTGKWDVVMTIVSDTEESFVVFYERLMELFGEDFQEKTVLQAISGFMTNEKYLFDGRTIYAVRHGFLSVNPVDVVDEALLSLIALDSRRSFTDLARRTGLTVEAIRYRFRQLKRRRNLIVSKIRIAVEKLGYAYYHLFIGTKDIAARKSIEEFYMQHPACITGMNHVGTYDLHVELVVMSDEIDKIIDEFRQRFGTRIAGYDLVEVRRESTPRMG